MSEISRSTIEIIGTLQADLGELRSRVSQLSADNIRLTDRHSNAKKLSAKDVIRMRSMYRAGTRQAELAETFDVNPATVSRTVRGVYWKTGR